MGAIVQAADDKKLPLCSASDVQVKAGIGLQANVEGHQIAIGGDALLSSLDIDTSAVQQVSDALAAEGKTRLFVVIDHQLAAIIAVADPVRDRGEPTYRKLRNKLSWCYIKVSQISCIRNQHYKNEHLTKKRP